MRILGVDPALRITGYGVIEVSGNRITLSGCGTIETDPEKPLEQRLLQIHRGLTQVLEKFRPRAMVLEKVFVHYRHTTTAFALGQARGVICLSCAEAAIPLVELAATQVKKAIVGRGHATKEQVQRMVARTLCMRSLPRHMDTTDALALAIALSHFIKVERTKGQV
jgi:crossover junction endodeoxyribonuclease RuvC